MTISKKLLLNGLLVLGMQSGLHADTTKNLPEQDVTEIKELTPAETLQSIVLTAALILVIAMANHDD